MPAPSLDNLIILHFDETSSFLSGLAVTSGLRIRFGHTVDPLPLDSNKERTWYDYATVLALAANRYCIAGFGLPKLLDRLRAPGVKFSCCLPLAGTGTLAEAEAAIAQLSHESLSSLIYSEAALDPRGPAGSDTATLAMLRAAGLTPERAQELDAIGGVLAVARPVPRILAEAESAARCAGLSPPSAAEIDAYRKLALLRLRANREASQQAG